MSENDRNLEKVNKNLQRLHNSLGSNGLSGLAISTDAGKTALSALLCESLDGEIRPDLAKEMIKKTLRLG